MTLQLDKPLPRRKAVQQLREQLVQDLVRSRPRVGSPFPSTAQLVEQTGASESSVRRALDALQREGWIERRMGKGTFVGPRAALAVEPGDGSSSSRPNALRMGVALFGKRDQRGDWYSRSVLEGIDNEAASRLVCVELYGSHDGDVHTVSQRLMASRPEVLACVLLSMRELAVVVEAQRLRIPVIGAGYQIAELGLPTILADDVGGAAMAVRHLVEHGHRRIGFVQPALGGAAWFNRREGYLRGLEEAGIEPDEGLVCWLPTDHATQHRPIDLGHLTPAWTEYLRTYLRRRQPTALVFGNGMAMEALAPLMREGELRVPEQLSLVTFDQTYEIYRNLLGGRQPTVVAMPWEGFGQQLVRMACDVAAGYDVKSPPKLPCQLVPGDTVAPVAGHD